MKCSVFVREIGMPMMPIIECGGSFLGIGESLIVREPTASALEKRYKGYIVKTGECERTSLRHGYFERSKEGVKEDKEDKPAPKESPLKERAMDRSMASAGKSKTRRKAKK